MTVTIAMTDLSIAFSTGRIDGTMRVARDFQLLDRILLIKLKIKIVLEKIGEFWEIFFDK